MGVPPVRPGMGSGFSTLGVMVPDPIAEVLGFRQ